MLYHSTRSGANPVDSARAVVQGLAPDGGLYMPEYIPDFDWKKCLRSDAIAMATQILSTLLPDIPRWTGWSKMPMWVSLKRKI